MTGALQTAGHCKLLGTGNTPGTIGIHALFPYLPGGLVTYPESTRPCTTTAAPHVARRNTTPCPGRIRCAVVELPPQEISQALAADRCKALAPFWKRVLRYILSPSCSGSSRRAACHHAHNIHTQAHNTQTQAAAAAAGAQHALGTTHVPNP